METNEKSVLDTILSVFSGDSKPEVIVTTKVELENATLLKIVGYGALLILGGIALSAWLLRATLKRFFRPI